MKGPAGSSSSGGRLLRRAVRLRQKKAYAAAPFPTLERLPMLRRKVSSMRGELLRKNQLPVRVNGHGAGQKGFAAGLFKILLHDLGTFEFRDRKFFKYSAVVGNPGRTTFNPLGGYFQIGQKERKSL